MGSKFTRDKRHGPENRFSAVLHKAKIKIKVVLINCPRDLCIQMKGLRHFPSSLASDEKSMFKVSVWIHRLSRGVIHVRIWANTIKIVNTYVSWIISMSSDTATVKLMSGASFPTLISYRKLSWIDSKRLFIMPRWHVLFLFISVMGDRCTWDSLDNTTWGNFICSAVLLARSMQCYKRKWVETHWDKLWLR